MTEQFSLHSKMLARLNEQAINTPENKRAIDCCSVGVTPSVKTTEIVPFWILYIHTTYSLLVNSVQAHIRCESILITKLIEAG